MVVVPAGKFTMGSPAGEKGRDSDEGPQHTVMIPRSFAAGKYEISRDEYARFAEATGRGEGDGCSSWTGTEWKKEASKSWRNPGFSQTERDPVVCVSWDDAKAYVRWLSEKTKKKYRLLTEAEWEYAARAGTTTSRFWGDNADQSCSYANVADLTAKDQFSSWTVANCRDSYVYTAPVGTFRPNGFGLYDVLGNVWEWVEDIYHDSYQGAPTDDSAWMGEGEKSSPDRVVRATTFAGSGLSGHSIRTLIFIAFPLGPVRLRESIRIHPELSAPPDHNRAALNVCRMVSASYA